MRAKSQASWSLRTEKVNPCDTTLLLPHQTIRELCMIPRRPPPPTNWLLKVLPLKPFWEREVLRIWATLSPCMSAQLVSCVGLFVTPWTVDRQGTLSMGLPGQEYWSGLKFPPPWDLPDTRIELVSPELAGGFFTTELPEKHGPQWIFLCSRLWHFTLFGLTVHEVHGPHK